MGICSVTKAGLQLYKDFISRQVEAGHIGRCSDSHWGLIHQMLCLNLWLGQTLSLEQGSGDKATHNIYMIGCIANISHN